MGPLFRQMNISMDGLKFAVNWSGAIPEAKLTANITGLQIEGATFDGASLRENAHNSPPIANMPPVAVAWIPKVWSLLKMYANFTI